MNHIFFHGFLCQESQNVAHVHLYCIDKQALVLWDDTSPASHITDPSFDWQESELETRKHAEAADLLVSRNVKLFSRCFVSLLRRRIVSIRFENLSKNLCQQKLSANSSTKNLLVCFSPLTHTSIKSQQKYHEQTNQQNLQGKLQEKRHRQAVVKSVLHLQGALRALEPKAQRGAAEAAVAAAWPDAAECRFEDLKVWSGDLFFFLQKSCFLLKKANWN